MPPSPIQKAGTPPVECPRCHSLDTKFCYYNNYNLSQPRHFCKSCRRYWTLGGTLRNVPVGGATRRRADSPSCSHPAKRRRHNPKQDPSEERVEPPVLSGQVAAAEPLAFLEEVGCFGLDLGLGLGAMEDLGFGVGRMEWQFPSEEIDVGGGVGVETWPLEGRGGEEMGCFAAAPDLPVSSEGKGVQQ